jgi:apolipoprotein N-acyltransferase
MISSPRIIFKLPWYTIHFSLAVGSSFLLILSFPKFDFGFSAWIGLIPLLIAINKKELKSGFLLSLVCGMIFFLGIFYWILEIKGYTLLHHALLALYLGSYFAMFGLGFCFISRRWGTTPALFSTPFIWVTLEYVRGNLSFLALPWGFLAHSQYRYPVVIQIASIVGSYGISFLIVLVNAALAFLVLERLKSPLPLELCKVQGCHAPNVVHRPTNRLPFLLITATSLLLFTLLYGYFTITDTITGSKVKISLIQGNIEQPKKWDPKFAREIMQTYVQLTEEASKAESTLVVWPETATPGSISTNPALHMELRSLVKRTGTYLLLGSAQHRKFTKEKMKDIRYTNSAYLLDPRPKLVRNQTYDKIYLFPFGEYLPYREMIPWDLININPSGSDNYVSGTEFTVFKHPDFRFGVTICWENIFPDLVRQFVKQGAQCIINLTNEAHFGKTAAPHQLVSMSVFRAVENKVYVIRCANTGVSCIIDPNGRIVDRVKDDKGHDIFIRGILTGYIIPLESTTIYTQFGDVLVWITFIESAVFLFVALFKKRK